jgi:aminocarboxymuconate-semialdehyde decarboxylase
LCIYILNYVCIFSIVESSRSPQRCAEPIINAELRVPTGIVDVHTHAIDVELFDLARRYPRDDWPSIERSSETEARLMFGGVPYRRIDHRCWSPRARLADMDREGVAIQVLSPIPVTFCYAASADGAADLAAAQNDFFASMIGEHPDRFLALGAVALQDPDRAVDELRRCMSRPGFLGVEIGTRVGDIELGDESLDRFFEVAYELGAMVFVHPSDQDIPQRIIDAGVGFGFGMPTETALGAAALIASGALARRPDVRICLAHGGGAFPAIVGRLDKGARLADAAISPSTLPSAQARQLWCDSLTYGRDALMAAAEVFGHDHVVFGSDYPFPAMPQPIDDVVTTVPADLHRRICRTNLEDHYGALFGSGIDALSVAGRDRRAYGRPAALDPH